jgi:ssDNA-binding replication factor A large subunit
LIIDDVLELFLKRVPELETEFKVFLKDNLIDEKDGLYVIWGMGMMPCIITAIKNKANENQLTRIFDFFEEMATSEEDVKELLMYSTLEKLGDEKEIFELAVPFMGKETRRLSDKVETFLGR